MAPSGEPYNVDWVFSNTSNVHLTNHRDWFTSYTPFKTECGCMYNETGSPVLGVGTVELNVRLYKQNRTGRPNSRVITLHDVLYSPDFLCNIFGYRAVSSEYSFQLGENGALTDKHGKRAGLIDTPVVARLRLHGQRVQSSLEDGGIYAINATWGATERARWEAHKAAQQSAPSAPPSDDAPYSSAEKAWLKKHYDGEFKFLRDHGWSIYKEEDRESGRALVRSLMKEDNDEKMELTNSAQVEDEGDSEDDSDTFLQELEDDPMSHMADYNFSAIELK